MDSLHFDLADEGQLESVAALFEAQLREHDITPPLADLRAAVLTVVRDRRYGFILTASVPAIGPVGVAYASCLLSLEHGGVSGWLEELYVLPQWRGRGIGSQLIEQVITNARQLRWRALDLEVEAGHQRAITLYARHNFRPHSRSRFYRIL